MHLTASIFSSTSRVPFQSSPMFESSLVAFTCEHPVASEKAAKGLRTDYEWRPSRTATANRRWSAAKGASFTPSRVELSDEAWLPSPKRRELSSCSHEHSLRAGWMNKAPFCRILCQRLFLCIAFKPQVDIGGRLRMVSNQKTVECYSSSLVPQRQYGIYICCPPRRQVARQQSHTNPQQGRSCKG